MIPGLGRFPGEGNGSPLQYSCLENPMGGRAWYATFPGVSKSRTRLSDFISLMTNNNVELFHLDNEMNNLDILLGEMSI